MKRVQMTTFTLEEGVKQGKLRKATNPMSPEESRIIEHGGHELHNTEGISDEMYEVLHTNPFMFNVDKSKYVIYSVEEFYVQTKKKETSPLGSVFRGNDYSKFQKKRIIKRAFKDWRNDFNLNKKQILSLNEDQITVVGDVTPAKIKLIHYLSFGIIFIFISMLMYRQGEMWEKAWTAKINEGISNALLVPWVSILGQAALLALIVAMMASSIYNEIINNYKQLSNDAPMLYKQAKEKVEKDFNKKYKETRKYYLKHLRRYNATVPTLMIAKTAVGEVDFDDIQKMTNVYVQKTANLKRKKTLMKIFNILTRYIPYFLSIVFVGYIIYSIIVSLF